VDSSPRGYRIAFYASLVLAALAVGMAYLSDQQRRQVEGRLGDVKLFEASSLAPARDQQFDFTVDNYGFVYKGRTGDHIDDYVLVYGAWEKHHLFFLRDYVKAVNDPEAVFVDVGAHTGTYSLFMAPHVKQIHAFEPFPPVLNRFREMIALNKITNIVVHDVGLGETAAKLPFFRSGAANSASGTFSTTFRPGDNPGPGESFQIVVGDDHLKPFKLSSLPLIKIDVEGFEEAVLKGLRRTLEQYRPVVVVEVTAPPKGTIASLDHLKTLFPEKYEFLYFNRDRTAYLSGAYELRDLTSIAKAFFGGQIEAQEDIVAYPVEQAARVPRRLRSQ
jgi:FkbM family methyltransferase